MFTHPYTKEPLEFKSKEELLGYFKNILDAAKAYDQYVIDNNLEHSRNFK